MITLMSGSQIFLVGLFGMAGVYFRFGIAKLLPFTDHSFPYATTLVNLVGSFAIGIILFSAETRLGLSRGVSTAIVVGFLGGLTTFSGFSYEGFKLIERADYFSAAAYLVGTPVLGILSVYLAKRLVGT